MVGGGVVKKAEFYRCCAKISTSSYEKKCFTAWKSVTHYALKLLLW